MDTKIRIRTTQHGLRNQSTSTEHGRVHFDAQGVAEVEPHVAQFLLGLPGFVDHEGSAAAAGVTLELGNSEKWPEETGANGANSANSANGDLTIKDVAKLAAIFGCDLKPQADPDWEVTLTDDELAALAQARGFVLLKTEDHAALYVARAEAERQAEEAKAAAVKAVEEAEARANAAAAKRMEAEAKKADDKAAKDASGK
jgi:hypothetical protein